MKSLDIVNVLGGFVKVDISNSIANFLCFLREF